MYRDEAVCTREVVSCQDSNVESSDGQSATERRREIGKRKEPLVIGALPLRCAPNWQHSTPMEREQEKEMKIRGYK
jgi:hypothetical protein